MPQRSGPPPGQRPGQVQPLDINPSVPSSVAGSSSTPYTHYPYPPAGPSGYSLADFGDHMSASSSTLSGSGSVNTQTVEQQNQQQQQGIGQSLQQEQEQQTTRPPRKLNRSANQLHRNQACLTCRRRRIKCDAGRPHCSSCVRSYRFLARTQPNPERDANGVQCVYEDNGEDNDMPLSTTGDSHAVVHKLEARVGESLLVPSTLRTYTCHPGLMLTLSEAELQGALDRLTSPTAPPPRLGGVYQEPTAVLGWGVMDASAATMSSSTPQPIRGRSDMFGGFHPGNSPQVADVGGQTHVLATGGGPIIAAELNTAGLRQQGLDPIALGTLTGDMTVSEAAIPSGGTMAATNIVPMPAGGDDGAAERPFLDMFWSGWPSRLPTPSLLDHL
jgi:hypothetical protein